MRILLGTPQLHEHMQQIAQALLEKGWLARYQSTGVDHFESPLARRCRAAIARVSSVDALLQRRRIHTVPPSLVRSDWSLEVPRVLARHARAPRLSDWIWERQERSLSRQLARLIESDQFDVVFGTEFGSLEAVRSANRSGKKSVVAFVSPHAATRRRWMEPEYARFPELLTPDVRRLLALSRIRQERTDAEANEATLVHTNSRFTTDSLVAAGIARAKIIEVPLAAPRPTGSRTPRSGRRPLRLIFAGKICVEKGIHYLFDAWRMLNVPSHVAELHCFGPMALPARIQRDMQSHVTLHGPISRARLFEEYGRSDVLVFPTLYDGFGLVISEALAHGVPVITTPNAGAADLVEDRRNGFIVPPADSEAIADRLDWCLTHSNELASMGEYAIASVQARNWDLFRREFITLLAAGLLAFPSRIHAHNESPGQSS